ncbi:MAG: DUF3185 domain-containing protein [wastewater metagenome]|nr:DUF3185 domain-containing protein [Candidatus Loosdrechtia aerotolerans]
MRRAYLFIGIALIVFGIISLVYEGITYTTKEKVLEVGPVEATAEKTRKIPVPPIVGGISLAGGIALIIIGSRR